MRKITLIIVALAFTIALSAHAASKVNISYNDKTGQVSVDFDHSVKSASDHYIQTLTLKVNNKTVISQVYTLQEKTAGGTAIYRIPGLKAGDVIEAITDCNKGGKRSAKLSLK